VARALTPAELDELLGAYALDALDADERAQVEAWLARSPVARREADELREAASLLAEPADAPSDDLWARIVSRLGDRPVRVETELPPLRLGELVDLTPRRAPAARRRPWLVGLAAALALAVAVGIGVVAGTRIADQDGRIDRLAQGMEKQAMARAALAATMEPDTRTADLMTADGHRMAFVVVTAGGRGYFMSSALPELPRGRTYQLWAVMGDGLSTPVVPAAVMGRDPHVMAFTNDPGVTRFVVTEEPAPGVVHTSQPPMLEGTLT